MRAADCIEKISSKTPKYLSKHKNEIFALCQEVRNKELQWHLAQMLSRLNLEDHEYAIAWKWLRDWALDASNSRIVRVNSLQALFDLSVRKDDKRRELNRLIAHLELENIPSLNARIRRIKRQILHAPS
jgi:cobalamin biosynthesis Mg chelatase CobN